MENIWREMGHVARPDKITQEALDRDDGHVVWAATTSLPTSYPCHVPEIDGKSAATPGAAHDLEAER
jgi:hypothetical protein